VLSNRCFQLAFKRGLKYVARVKATTALTLRDCPAGLHSALKDSARKNRRSLNAEALTWLERQSTAKPRRMSGKQFAAVLRKFQKQFTPKEHAEIAARIEAYRKKNRGDAH
jgi:hypothetical protein